MAANLQVRSYSVVEKNLTSSQPLAAVAIAYLVPSFTKHWGVVLDVYDGNDIPRYTPGFTKTSYHTISIYEKLLLIQFHTIPYVQKIV